MSVNEFDCCTPDEFQAIYNLWQRYNVQEKWERTRFLACCMLQPWSKKALKATDVCRFEWDEKKHAEAHEASTRERFEELKKKVGNQS